MPCPVAAGAIKEKRVNPAHIRSLADTIPDLAMLIIPVICFNYLSAAIASAHNRRYKLKRLKNITTLFSIS